MWLEAGQPVELVARQPDIVADRDRHTVEYRSLAQPERRALRSARSSSSGRVFNTSSAVSQPRRALPTPNCTYSSSLVLWASLLMVNRAPSPFARRAQSP